MFNDTPAQKQVGYWVSINGNNKTNKRGNIKYGYNKCKSVQNKLSVIILIKMYNKTDIL